MHKTHRRIKPRSTVKYYLFRCQSSETFQLLNKMHSRWKHSAEENSWARGHRDGHDRQRLCARGEATLCLLFGKAESSLFQGLPFVWSGAWEKSREKGEQSGPHPAGMSGSERGQRLPSVRISVNISCSGAFHRPPDFNKNISKTLSVTPKVQKDPPHPMGLRKSQGARTADGLARLSPRVRDEHTVVPPSVRFEM